MKKLYLVRHAKSSWKNPELTDIERPLNKRGKRDAPFIGNVLKEKNIIPDLIISSPAKRAAKTAVVIADKIGYTKSKIINDDNIYEASFSELLDLIRNLDDKHNTVMLFGHNPGLTMLNNYLSEHYIDNIPTCGVVGIQFDSSWNGIKADSGNSFLYIYPKIFVKKN
jgi:phosphohistidine phosphatase